MNPLGETRWASNGDYYPQDFILFTRILCFGKKYSLSLFLSPPLSSLSVANAIATSNKQRTRGDILTRMKPDSYSLSGAVIERDRGGRDEEASATRIPSRQQRREKIIAGGPWSLE